MDCDPICPLDYRYGQKQMKSVFSRNTRLLNLLEVEAALAQALGRTGIIPENQADEIAAVATSQKIDLDRIDQIERETNHELMSVVKALTEQCGKEAGKWVHLGATSSDILDTAMAMAFRDGLTIIEHDIFLMINVLKDLAIKYKVQPIIGRTHGQWAIPMSLGLKFAVWYSEMNRHLIRLNEMRDRLAVGKMSGAVGSGASWGERSIEIEKTVLDILGLGREDFASQVVQRDRYAELIGWMSNTATTLEKISTEIRNLQRSEIQEISEKFQEESQVGSSTMAQKVNPITCENICSLARMIRGYLVPSLENAILWNERDLTNSANERIIYSHAFILLDDILIKSVNVLKNLNVRPTKMLENLQSAGTSVMAEALMYSLTIKGMGRQDAHELVRIMSIKARKNNSQLKETACQDPEVLELFSLDELEEIFNIMKYVEQAGRRVEFFLE